MADDVTLKGASIWFLTGNDDKDADTGVDISITDQDGNTVANGSVPPMGFPDGYRSQAFPLQVQGDALKDDIEGGQVIITINPNGHDTWVFSAHVRLRFSDHTKLLCDAPNMNLDQDHRTAIIPIPDRGLRVMYGVVQKNWVQAGRDRRDRITLPEAETEEAGRH